MTADRMTSEDARERLAFYATFSDAVDQITTAYDALAVLVDWPELLKAGERAGKVEQGVGVPYGIEWRSGTPSPEEWLRATAGTTPVWRLVPREHGSEKETT